MKSTKIIGLGAAFFLLFIPVTQAINIDTRIGHAQATQSYFYATPQAFHDTDATFGDVDFAGGMGLYANGGFQCSITLGIQPPISGAIRFSGGSFIGSFFITTANDLTLSCTQIDVGHQGSNGEFLITGPNRVFLTRDFTTPNYFGSGIFFVSSTNGILNGLGNSFFLNNVGNLSFQSNPPGGLTVQDLNITGTSGSFFLNGSGPLTLQNIQVTMFPGQQIYFTSEQTAENITYVGRDNIIGNGGFVQFSAYFAGSTSVTLATETNLHVLPNTILSLAKMWPTNTFSFNFTDVTSQLYLDNCTLQIGSNLLFTSFTPGQVTNLVFTKGTIVVNGTVNLQTDVPGSSLQLGDGVNQSNNCELILLAGAKLIIDNGMTFSNMNV